MAIKPFIELLIEFNNLDNFRDTKLDNILLDMILDFDNFKADKTLETINGFFMPKIIKKLFDNTEILIQYFESNEQHKKRLFDLKNDRTKYLTPIINQLKNELKLLEAKGNTQEEIKIKTAILMHSIFLKSPYNAIKLFNDSKIFLSKNKKQLHIFKLHKTVPKKHRKTEDKLLFHEQVSNISKFYNGFEIMTNGYKKTLWHSTAIKIFKLTKILNPNMVDTNLKNLILELFATKNIKLSLDTKRLNEAILYTIVEKQPIWIYKGKKESLENTTYIDKKLKEHIGTKLLTTNNEQEKRYLEILKDTPSSLFLIS